MDLSLDWRKLSQTPTNRSGILDLVYEDERERVGSVLESAQSEW